MANKINEDVNWQYVDARGKKQIGKVDKVLDHGGTDITYFFKNSKTGKIDVISGSLLKKANPIYKKESKLAEGKLKVKDWVVGNTTSYKNASGFVYKVEGDKIYLKDKYGNEEKRAFPSSQFKKGKAPKMESKLTEGKFKVGAKIQMYDNPGLRSDTVALLTGKIVKYAGKEGNEKVWLVKWDKKPGSMQVGETDMQVVENKLTENSLRQAIRAMIEQELDKFDVDDEEDKTDVMETSSVTAQGGQDGYQTPYAFAKSLKDRTREISQQLGYKLVNEPEDRDWKDLEDARKEPLVYRKKFADMKKRSGLGEGIIKEEKSVSYDLAEKFAKKNKIKYTTIKNKYTGKDEIVFYGSAKDFFNQKEKTKFVQLTEPTGFDEKSTSKLNISVGIPAGGGQTSIIRYVVNATSVKESIMNEEVNQEAKDEVSALLKKYKGGEVPDSEVHAVAEKHGISPHDLESYIYSLASAHVNEGKDETAKIYIGNEPWWIRKMGDTTHFHMSNSEKGIKAGGTVFHVGQHRDEEYYNDIVKWLKGQGKMDGKKYKKFFRQNESINEEVGQEVKDEVTTLLKKYKGGEVPDSEVHAVAEKHGISPHDLESYIYSLASAHVNEALNKNQTFYIHDAQGSLMRKMRGLDGALKYIKSLKYNAQLNVLENGKYRMVYAHVVDKNDLSNQMGSNLKIKHNTLVEGRRGAYHEYRDNEDMTPRQKIGESLRNVRDQLTEIEKTIDLNLRLKQETGIDTQQYWKNTHRALNRINERMTRIINKIRRF